MKNTPPPSRQQAEEAQQARHQAELAILALFVASGTGGGSGENESSTIESVKIVAILSALTAAIVASSFRHPRDRSRSLLTVRPDNKALAEDSLQGAQAHFDMLKSLDITDEERAVSWATWAYSHAADRVAASISDADLADNGQLRKVWISRFDRKVRPLHAKLHGKAVPVGEDFWRWPQTGQRLRWPGDREAPLDATIGCRCVSLLTWANQGEVSQTIRRIVDHTKGTE